MKRLFMIVLVLMLALVPGCGEDPPPPAKKQVPKPKEQVKKQVQPQENEIRENTVEKTKADLWPFITGDQAETELADNYMAKNYMLIFDGSGSMKESKCSGSRSKIQVAKDAVVEWSKTVPGDANLGLIAFHRKGWASIPLAAGQRQGFVNKARRIAAGGGTPLSKAFENAYQALTKQGQKQLGYGEYTIVVVTDGIANNGETLSGWVNRILAESPINIYTIGFCIGKKHSLNQPGRTIYKPAANPAELRKGLKEVLAESETFDDSDFNQ